MRQGCDHQRRYCDAGNQGWMVPSRKRQQAPHGHCGYGPDLAPASRGKPAVIPLLLCHPCIVASKG
jgi:hypothetical protein